MLMPARGKAPPLHPPSKEPDSFEIHRNQTQHFSVGPIFATAFPMDCPDGRSSIGYQKSAQVNACSRTSAFFQLHLSPFCWNLCCMGKSKSGDHFQSWQFFRIFLFYLQHISSCTHHYHTHYRCRGRSICLLIRKCFELFRFQGFRI